MQKYEADPKHGLYRHHLRVIAVHRPPVFVTENVKGLLSAKVKEERIFERILKDLARPAVAGQVECDAPDLEYKLVSLVQRTEADHHEPEEFVVCSEEYGIPQARHRITWLAPRQAEREVSFHEVGNGNRADGAASAPAFPALCFCRECGSCSRNGARAKGGLYPYS
jgi:site-specific DNA-cytosine methylase